MPLPTLRGVLTIALLLEALDKERESHGPTYSVKGNDLREQRVRGRNSLCPSWNPSCLGEFATFRKIATCSRWTVWQEKR